MNLDKLLKTYDRLKRLFEKHNIHPILYGSVGASYYVGEFKQFNDLDLLIEDKWVKDKWKEFKLIMRHIGFEVVDEKEHEFINEDKIKVAFAEQGVLIRDKVCNLTTDIVLRKYKEVEIKTLTAKSFLNAYKFSVDDGYRLTHRNKKDKQAMAMLNKYLKDTNKSSS